MIAMHSCNVKKVKNLCVMSVWFLAITRGGRGDFNESRSV